MPGIPDISTLRSLGIGPSAASATAGGSSGVAAGSGDSGSSHPSIESLISRVAQRTPSPIADALAGIGQSSEVSARLEEITRRIAGRAEREGVIAVAAPPTEVSGGGPNAAPDIGVIVPVTDQDQREILELRQQDARWRAQRVGETLGGRMQDGARAASMRGNPTAAAAAVAPRSEEEATAAAERLTIDMIQAVAELDVTRAELDVATFDAQSGDATAQRRAQQLSAEYANRYAEVEALIEAYDIVQARSEGQPVHAADGVVMAPDGQMLTVEWLRDASVDEARTGDSDKVDALAKVVENSFVQLSNILSRSVDRMVSASREARERRRAEDMALADQKAAQRKADRQLADQKAAERRARSQRA